MFRNEKKAAHVRENVQLSSLKTRAIIFTLQLISLALIILAVLHVYKAVEALIDNDYLYWQYIIIITQVCIEIFVFIETSSMIFGISQSVFLESEKISTKELTTYPDLDVFVPIREVDIDTLEVTLKAIRTNDYPQNKLHLFVCDDTPEKTLSEQYRKLSRDYRAKYVYDPTNTKYKAGMVNIALKKGKSEYTSFFDYDQVPTNGIFKHFIEVLEANPDRVFVQAKKTFKDLYNRSRVWSALMYVQFFEVFEKTKQQNKTVMFAGSTACFRRSAIDEIGGLPENTFTEDNDLTVSLLLEGKHGIFSNINGSMGTVPYGFPSQIAQLWRWSHGGTHVLSRHLIEIIKSKHLTLSQKIDIIATFAITPTLVFVYLYSLSFVPLILTGVDSLRFLIFGVSTLAAITFAPALTYLIIAMIALWAGKKHQPTEFAYHDLPGFITIAMASNILILDSGLTGLLGIWGPKSKYGAWTRKVRIFPIAFIGFIIGLIVEYFAITWLLDGYTSAIILVLIGFTLLPTLPVALYYNRPSKF